MHTYLLYHNVKLLERNLHALYLSSIIPGDVPVEVLTQIVATISDPSAMLGPEVNKTCSETSHFIV